MVFFVSSLFFLLPLNFAFELTILHVNDIHVRIDETDIFSESCKKQGECYGGVARLKYQVDALKETNKIFLNAGDFYQGTEWYSHFKWRAVAHFANLLKFNVMSLGNHEFDDNIEGLVPFLKNASFPIVACNVDISKEPRLQGLVTPSTIVNMGGVNIGIIGYVTTDTASISVPGATVTFIDEITAIKAEAKKLSAQGIKVLIALGHSGLPKDKQIAQEVPELDIVVGGHSHSFLYKTKNGMLPSNESPVDVYPVIVTQPSGRSVLVVQAYAFTKYLGRIRLIFNKELEVTGYEGSPILLSSSVGQDQYILSQLQSWKNILNSIQNFDIGETRVHLSTNRQEQTFFADIFCDAMVYSVHTKQTKLAFVNSGGIRGVIPVGTITTRSLSTVVPFADTFDVIQIKGKHFNAIFEQSFSRFVSDGTNLYGGFIIVSGFRIVADVTRPVNSRVLNIKVVNLNGIYEDVNPETIYDVVTTNFVASGGDGQSVLRDNKIFTSKGAKDIDALSAYLKLISPILSSKKEERITIYTSTKRPLKRSREFQLLKFHKPRNLSPYILSRLRK